MGNRLSFPSGTWYIYEGFTSKKDPAYKELLHSKQDVVILGYYNDKLIRMKAVLSFIIPKFEQEALHRKVLKGAVLVGFIVVGLLGIGAFYFRKKQKI